MPNETATNLAEQILNDLSGATYYADPSILAGVMQAPLGLEAPDRGAAIEVLRELLRHYATECASVSDVNMLATLLQGIGVQ